MKTNNLFFIQHFCYTTIAQNLDAKLNSSTQTMTAMVRFIRNGATYAN